MNGLTLKQLRKAIKVVRTSKKFESVRNDTVPHLVIAEAYMMGLGDLFVDRRADPQHDTPRDPREVLVEIGYKL